MGYTTQQPGGTVLMVKIKSYKMRMYQRRLWQQRGIIVMTGATIWAVIAIIIVLAVKAAQ
jgi:hypothetical protein